ncbi:MAG: helix-turn-helix transcriptional regulator [Thermoanaerobaculia bacterium]|nr:helix-turn-helix transcriptional regulator [Thermoanaerobaculia bacterium]
MTFGARLREWRKRRGLSQLDLGLDAEVSARHLSFLETGRSNPSREMVLRLGAALDLPLRERNELLLEAGFAPEFEERGWDDDELAAVERGLEHLLEAHDPYPAFVIDRYWDLVRWNRSHEALLGEIEGYGRSEPVNALELLLRPGALRDRVANWDEVAAVVMARLERQIARTGDERLRRLWDWAREQPGVFEVTAAGRPTTRRPFVPLELDLGSRPLGAGHLGDGRLRLFNTLAVVGATGDVTLDEMVIEAFYPADEATREFLQERARRATT